MRWRLLRLNWAYAVGELVIVVAGVLIALAVDQWNSDRLERVEEVEIIDGFLSDLREDIEDISLGLEILPEKETRLLRISSSLETFDHRPNDISRFLEDIVGSTPYGWNQARARRTTLDEVLGSGKFGLIRDAALRVKISEYYDFDLSVSNRINERETEYPSLAYRLVPRSTEGEVETNLSDAQKQRLVERIFDSPLRDHVVGEINFSRFVNERLTFWKALCLELIDELEAYRIAIE